MLFIPGDMTVPEHYTASIGKLPTCHALTMMCIAQDMHNADSAMPNHNLALNRQLLYYLVPLDIALHSHHGRDGL